MALNYVKGDPSNPKRAAVFYFKLSVNQHLHAFEGGLRQESAFTELYKSPDSKFHTPKVWRPYITDVVHLPEDAAARDLEGTVKLKGDDLIDLGTFLLPSEAEPRIIDAVNEYLADCMQALKRGP